MKKIPALLILNVLYFLLPLTSAARGKYVVDSMESAILGEMRHFAVYLPESYDNDTVREYPVLYLLHGGGGSWGDWGRVGNMVRIAEQ